MAILARSTLTSSMRALESSDGFPDLPDVEIECVGAPKAPESAERFQTSVMRAIG